MRAATRPPSPRFLSPSVKIYQADALTLLRSYEPGQIDHLVTDPPYSEHTHGNVKRLRGDEGESLGRRDLGFAHLSPRVRAEVAREAARLVARWVLIFSDDQGVPAWRRDLERAGLEVVRVGVWIKNNPTPQLTGDRPGQGCEWIVIAHRPGKKRWNGGGKAGVWRSNVAKDGHHPTSKPVVLLSQLLRDFTDPGETVIDPFAGGGSTLVAAKEIGRIAIGGDADDRHCQTMRERTRQESFSFTAADCEGAIDADVLRALPELQHRAPRQDLGAWFQLARRGLDAAGAR